MRYVLIPNTPHPYIQQLVIFEVLNELNCIWETCFQQFNFLFFPQDKVKIGGTSLQMHYPPKGT
jgi:hypothetical protein